MKINCRSARFLVVAAVTIAALTASAVAADFDLRKVVPAAAFTTKVPCNGCAFTGHPTQRPSPVPTVDPCGRCKKFVSRQSEPDINVTKATLICAHCALRKLDTSGRAVQLQPSVKQANAYEILFIAVEKVRHITPTVTYKGSAGGEGCSPIQIAFGVPGCEVTHFSGTALRLQLIVSSGLFSNWLAFQVPAGTKHVWMYVPRSGICGRRYGSNSCSNHAHPFYLSAVTQHSVAPGCNIMDYQRKVRRFLFWCEWRDCADTKFAARLYTTFTQYKKVTMSGSYVSTSTSACSNLFIP